MSGTLRLRGATSGYSELQAPAVAADQTFILPTAGGTLLTTDSPISKLTLELGSASQPSLTFEGDTDTGLYSSGTNTLNLVTGGNNRLNIDSSGRVGINTTSPTKSLDVNGTFRVVNEATFDNDVIVHQVMTWLRNDGVTDCGSVGNADYLYATGADTDLAIKAETGDITFVTSGGGGLERLRIDSSGNVGIGTISPQHRLSVERDVGIYRASSDPTLSLSVGGTIASPTKTYNLLIDDSDSDKLQIRDGSTARVTLDSSGKVGIGTSSPVDNGSDTMLALHRGGGQSTSLAIQAGASASSLIRFADGTSTAEERNAGYIIVSHSDQSMQFGIQNAEQMRIDGFGRLLLGTTTEGVANGGDQFTIGVAGNNNAGMTIRSGTSTRGAIYFSDGTSGTAEFQGFIEYLQGASGYMRFGTDAVERMRIDTAGRLLVGTTVEGQSPNGEALTVANNGHCGITVRSTSSTTGNLYFSDATSGTGEYAGAIVYDHSNDDLKLYTNGGQERMRIDSSGNVGIGTASPNSYVGWKVLTLNGTVGGEIDFETNGTNTAQIYSSATSTYINRLSASGDIIFLAGSGVERMRIASTGAIVLPNGSPGIQFGTFSSPVTSTNLDDYEEGTFTPTIQGTASVGTATYTNNWGQYVKVGQLVTAQIYLSWNSGTGSGSLRIHDLPFNVNTIVNSYGGVAIGYWHAVPLATNYYPQLFLANTSNFINCYQAPLGGGSSSVVPYAATGGGIIVTVTYRSA